MPATVEGIGTKYYGKRNLKKYSGQCEFCHRQVELQEYETTYWFVVLYVPVVPLGRKQVLSFCPACRRHRVLPLAKWEEIKEQKISQDSSSLGENPDDPNTALQLLRTLAGFNRFEEAEKLASGIQQRFADSPDVMLQIAHWHDFRNRRGEADACYRAVLELDSNNLEAKRGLALGCIAAGNPQEALALVTADPPITPQQDVGLYVTLAKGFAQCGQHEAALDAFEQLIATRPSLAFDKQLRKLVQASEKQAARSRSILPRLPFFKNGAAMAAAAAALALLAAGVANLYISRHRALHIVNGFGVPVDVKLDDEPAISVAPHTWYAATVAEGAHRASVSAGATPLREDVFDVQSSFFDRFFQHPIFVLNAGNGAAILWEQVVYSAQPQGGGDGRLHVGQPFLSFADVDFGFVDPPKTLQLEGGKPVTKTHVGLFDLQPAQITRVRTGMVSLEDQLAFLEAHLTAVPNDAPLLQVYAQQAVLNQQAARAWKFMQPRLDEVPARIEWHRVGQQIADDAQRQQLRQGYLKRLEEEPGDSKVLYLAGRMEQRGEAAHDYYQRAIAADPRNAYAWNAEAYRMYVGGDFAGAKQACLKAVALEPANEDFRDRLLDIRFALKEYDSLERELRESLKISPDNFGSHVRLLQVLAGKGRATQARMASGEYARAARARGGTAQPDPSEALASELVARYLTQDFASIRDTADEWAGSAASIRFQADLESGKYDAAEADLEALADGADPFDELRLAIAWESRGDAARADAWRAKACAHLEQSVAEYREVAAVLRQGSRVSFDRARDLTLEPRPKAVALVALAQQSTEHKNELLDLAEKLNFSPLFSHHFLKAAIAATRKEM